MTCSIPNSAYYLLKRLAKRKALSAAMGLVLASVGFSFGQEQQFAFDENGNLWTQGAVVAAPPQILAHPQPQVVSPDALASFFVVVADTSGLAYQWRFNGTNISNAINDALLLTNVTVANEGLYSVVLANSSGSVTSAPAALMIDSDSDGLADSWELAYFANLTNSASGDRDGDGVSNGDEFLDGTNPTNSASAFFRLTVSSDGGLVTVSPLKLKYTNGEGVTVTASNIGTDKFHGWTGDVVGTNTTLMLTMTRNRSLFAHFSYYTLTFTNTVSGADWHSVLNWSPNLVPAMGDTAVVNTTVTANNNAECGALLLGGSIGGSSTLTVHSNGVWTSGSMTGAGRTIISSNAIFTINNASTVFLDTRTLENAGTILWTGADNFNLQCSGPGITNRPGALFEVRNNGGFYPFPASSRFDNAGTLRKTTGAGTTTFAVNNSFGTVFPFNNYGVTEIQTGTLLCSATCVNNGAVTLSPGTTLRMAAGGAASGTFTNPAGALVDWTGSGTFTVSSGALLNGSGLYKVSGGTLTLNTDLAVQNLDLLATLNGSGRLTVNNVLNWTAGNMSGSGRTIIAPGATNYINNLSSTVFLDTRTLENAGTIVWTGADNFNIQASGAVITNRPGALFEVRNNGSFYPFPASSRFDNAGTLRKTTGSGTTTFAVNTSFGTVFPFNNYGTLEIRNGIVAATGGYACTSGSSLQCVFGSLSTYGRLQASGTVALNGALRVSLTNGFVPASNDTFTVFSASTRNGAFASFTYPSNVVAMQLSNTTTSVILRVTDITLTSGPPVITLDLPSTQVIYAGRVLTQSVNVAGASPFTYQWKKNGADLSDDARINGSQSKTLIVSNASFADIGNYQLFVTNSEGSSNSRASTVIVQAVPKFNAAGAGWSLQGTTLPPMNSNNVTLTSGLGSTARNVFYNAPLYIAAFQAQFVYVDVGGGGADGITFCLHNDPRGAATLGGGGGGIGYAGISPSAALALNIYQPNTRGMSWRTNGTLPPPSPYNPIGPVNLASGNPIHVSLLYTGGVLKVTFVESNTANTFATNLAVNLPAIVGGQTAFVGFTGGDGGVASTQVVSNFTFVPITGVAAEQAWPSTVSLTWPASIGGYRVQSKTNLNTGADVWQNVTNAMNQSGGQNRVTISPPIGDRYLRLFINPTE
jgi:hypothetical protein